MDSVRLVCPGFAECLRRDHRLRRPSSVAAALAGLIAALPIAGCGGASHAPTSTQRASSTAIATRQASSSAAAAGPPSACVPAAVAAVARFMRVGEGAVATRSITSNSSGVPQCNFTVRAGSHKVLLWVSADSSPQPYAVLERAAEEGAQNFANDPRAQFPAPQQVAHLGLDAYWFPGPGPAHMLATDAVRLITATIVRWPGVSRKHWNALAAAAARPYLRRSQPKLARGPSP